jgi:mannose-6-phosphate isomerase-like protein (cupin superfamily)
VLNGRGRARIADEVFDVEPGDLLAIREEDSAASTRY